MDFEDALRAIHELIGRRISVSVQARDGGVWWASFSGWLTRGDNIDSPRATATAGEVFVLQFSPQPDVGGPAPFRSDAAVLVFSPRDFVAARWVHDGAREPDLHVELGPVLVTLVRDR